MTDEVTEGIRVSVRAVYVPERSSPDQDHYFFAYTVRIQNEGTAPAQLISRHWIITDARGRVEHVKGPGVVGETPRLEPGDAFEYTSYCPLTTSSGAMRGSYQMKRDDGRAFDAAIGVFTLMATHMLN
jgi:ApaG protein